MEPFYVFLCLVVTVIFGGGIVLTVVILRSAVREDRRRLDRLRAWAASSGWAIAPNPMVDWGARMPGGNRNGVSVAVSGTVAGYPVSVADYHVGVPVLVGAGATVIVTQQKRFYTAIVVRVPGRYSPVAVRKRGVASRFGHALSGGSAFIVGNVEFDRRFRVVAADPAAARLVGPALVAEHLRGVAPPWSLAGSELLAVLPGRIDHPERIVAAVLPVVRVATLLGR